MKRLGKRRLQEGMESEALEITVEGDLAVVKVEGEEVEAVKIEEGDDLVQVVEEIKTDYLEGKLGKGTKGPRSKRRLQEGTGGTNREVMGNWVVYFDTDEDGNVESISQVQHVRRDNTVTISAGSNFR